MPLFNMGNMSGKREIRVVMIGLDGSGKTTIFYKLKLGEVLSTKPTIGFNVETVEHKNISFTVWDVGGQYKLRPLWRHYFACLQAVIFVVDSNDTERILEAREELRSILKEGELKDTILLVLANKSVRILLLSIFPVSEQASFHLRHPVSSRERRSTDSRAKAEHI